MSYPAFGEEWRKRWVQLPSGVILHRVASTVPPTDEQWAETQKMDAELYAAYGLEFKPKIDRDDWDADGLIPRGIRGTTVCGLSGRLGMPGLFSRMGAPRCKRCCRKLGIPAGDGAPYNDKALSEEKRNT